MVAECALPAEACGVPLCLLSHKGEVPLPDALPAGSDAFRYVAPILLFFGGALTTATLLSSLLSHASPFFFSVCVCSQPVRLRFLRLRRSALHITHKHRRRRPPPSRHASSPPGTPCSLRCRPRGWHAAARVASHLSQTRTANLCEGRTNARNPAQGGGTVLRRHGRMGARGYTAQEGGSGVSAAMPRSAEWSGRSADRWRFLSGAPARDRRERSYSIITYGIE